MSFIEEPDQPRPETPNNAGWATFEARVRARRLSACVERAGSLIDSGQLAEAREAISEARQLAPDAPEIAELEQRINARPSPGAVLLATPERLPVAIEPIDHAGLPAPEAPEIERIYARPSPGAILLATPELLPVATEIEPSREWPRMLAAIAVVMALFFAAGYGVVKFRHKFPILEFLSKEDAPAAPLTQAAKEPESPVAIRAPETEVPAPPPVAPPTPAPVAEPKEAQPESAPSSALPPAPTQRAEQPAPPDRRSAPPAAPTIPIGQGRVVPPVTNANQAPTQPSTQPERTLIPQVKPLADARPVEAVALEMTSPTPTATTGAQPMATLDAPVPAPPPAGSGESRHDESLRIRAVLLRFETAYNRLDAKAARAVWPGVNEPALNRAFSGLVSQRVSLGLCDITVFGDIAGASCAGKARWEPKVGGGLQTADRYWTFQLAKSAEGWSIKEVLVR